MEQEMVWFTIPAGQAAEKRYRDPGPVCKGGSEENLIHAAQLGDLSAFNCLVETYQDSLYGWVVSLVSNEALAEDITQQTFVTAYEKIHTFRGGSLQSWLFKIARNRSIDALRFHKRHPSVSLDANSQDEDGDGLIAVLPDGAQSPEEAVIQAEAADWLQQLLDRVPEPYQQALRLVDLYEMDYSQVSEVLNLPSGTVKSRVARGRLKLKEMIAQQPGVL